MLRRTSTVVATARFTGGTHLLGDEATDAFESARGALASFVGVSPDEIVWTKNATEAINLVALSMGNASQGMGGAESAALRVGPGGPDRVHPR